MKNIAIIGAGISGLTAAYQLQKKGFACEVFEASEQAGGCIRTLRAEGRVLELGPNSIMCDQKMLAFFEELGLSANIIPSNEVSKNRYVYKDGRLQKLPSSPPALLASPFFGLKTKLNIFTEPFRRKQNNKEESLSQFIGRRFGQEVVEYALKPFIAGIYAGKPEDLLLSETFPQLAGFEDKYGSVIKGMLKSGMGERRKSCTFTDGMAELPEALAAHLNIRYESPVLALGKANDTYFVECAQGRFEYDGLVLSLPAQQAATLLENAYPAASALKALEYPPMSIVHSVYRQSDVAYPLDGFGALHPQKEGLFTAGSIWSSSVFAGRCPEGEVLLTSFIGGAQHAEKTSLSQQEIIEKTNIENKNIYGFNRKPIYNHYTKWPLAIPQYTRAILKSKAFVRELEKDGIYVCANWEGGVSIPDCMRKGEETADKVAL